MLPCCSSATAFVHIISAPTNIYSCLACYATAPQRAYRVLRRALPTNTPAHTHTLTAWACGFVLAAPGSRNFHLPARAHTRLRRIQLALPSALCGAKPALPRQRTSTLTRNLKGIPCIDIATPSREPLPATPTPLQHSLTFRMWSWVWLRDMHCTASSEDTGILLPARNNTTLPFLHYTARLAHSTPA